MIKLAVLLYVVSLFCAVYIFWPAISKNEYAQKVSAQVLSFIYPSIDTINKMDDPFAPKIPPPTPPSEPHLESSPPPPPPPPLSGN